MGALTNEPSMEDILSSIKRIIADEDQGRSSGAPRAPRRKAAVATLPVPEPESQTGAEADDQVLELTDALDNEPEAAASDDESKLMTPPASPKPSPKAPAPARATAPAPPADEPAAVLSDTSAQAARQALSNLSALLVRPEEAPSNTLEGLVREMLRPMLKEWLDANLPTLVEGMVKREIDRITGRV